ncbi:MAG: serine protease [Candidatus Marinimicrobia bacterium]|nr:serine protease [Candidatus Neomarinimicrobiota bacterium]MCF7828022.1 serine protease [Candidatus Neomarinimicrobiota bacterium]MCF7879223.1 serine protease [Candidatus Neomarinimicrobiota bacterium]
MRLRFIPYFLALTLTVSCATPIFQFDDQGHSDRKYDSRYPASDVSNTLGEMVKSVRKINSMAFYRSFTISEESKLRRSEIRREYVKQIAIEDTIYDQTVLGTATVLHAEDRWLVALTCAHIIDFPDTIIRYYPEPGNPSERNVQMVAFKIRQQNSIPSFPNDAKVEVLAENRRLDAALIGVRFEYNPENPVPVFPFPAGKSRQLNWGHFVYLAGYPMSTRMITRGIVSRPQTNAENRFIIDAVFNPGMSGGPVVAIRDGIPNFEFVGIVRATAAEPYHVLTPTSEKGDMQSEYYPNLPHRDEIYTTFIQGIRYGITYVIPIENILRFIREHQPDLQSKGYSLSKFLAKR